MLEISQVSKTFFPNTVNERRALQGIDLHLAEGDFVTVIGSNGAGKSTILNTIAGKLLPDTGTVAVGGKDVTRMPVHRRAASIVRVFQDPTAGTAPRCSSARAAATSSASWWPPGSSAAPPSTARTAARWPPC